MGIKGIDINKDGITLASNLFDGDDSNSNNVFDRISHQMVDSTIDAKIDSVLKECNVPDKKTTE